MHRRRFLQEISAQTIGAASAVIALRKIAGVAAPTDRPAPWIDPPVARDWQARWERFILADSAKNRYCDTEMAEELGWLVSPFLDGFYYGYMATRDPKWVERLVDWADSCVRRAVKEPDGYLG